MIIKTAKYIATCTIFFTPFISTVNAELIDNSVSNKTVIQAKAKSTEQIASQKKHEQELKALVEKKAKENAEKSAKARLKAKEAAKDEANKKLAEDKKVAEAKTKQQAKADEKAKREAENQARLDAQKKAVAESEARLKALAEERKQAKEAKAKAKAGEKAKREAERKAKVDVKNLASNGKVDAQPVSKDEIKPQSVIAEQPKVVVEQRNRTYQEPNAMEAFKAQQQAEAIQLSILKKDSLKTTPLQTAISNVSQSVTGESALQKATSGLMVAPKTNKDAIRVKLFGFHATPEQKDKINARYAYPTSTLTVMPEKIGKIKLRPRIALVNSKLEMFNTPADKKAAEEFFAYHPQHSQVFAAYVTRIMTLNNGNTGAVTLDKGFMSELTYNFAETPVPSVASMQKAQDQYLYITSRLTETDGIKFWNWINSIRESDKINIPDWVVLANILNS